MKICIATALAVLLNALMKPVPVSPGLGAKPCQEVRDVSVSGGAAVLRLGLRWRIQVEQVYSGVPATRTLCCMVLPVLLGTRRAAAALATVTGGKRLSSCMNAHQRGGCCRGHKPGASQVHTSSVPSSGISAAPLPRSCSPPGRGQSHVCLLLPDFKSFWLSLKWVSPRP